jgi:hypothetical protein
MESIIISEGTLRPQDLIPAFLDALRVQAPTEYEQIVSAPFSIPPAYAMEDHHSEWWDSEECSFFLQELQDLLSESAPEGMYFGTLEGDGACFGFFSLHNENNIVGALRTEENGFTLPKYAWPGGYPIFYADSEGNALCPDCANENDEFSAELVAYDINWEDPALYCDHCGERIESAYADE